jgi:hypothetical protein
MTLYLGRYLPFYRYKKHLHLKSRLSQIIKNASVGTEAEVTCGRYNAIPCVVGGGNCSFYPHCRPDSFNSQGS